MCKIFLFHSLINKIWAHLQVLTTYGHHSAPPSLVVAKLGFMPWFSYVMKVSLRDESSSAIHDDGAHAISTQIHYYFYVF